MIKTTLGQTVIVGLEQDKVHLMVEDDDCVASTDLTIAEAEALQKQLSQAIEKAKVAAAKKWIKGLGKALKAVNEGDSGAMLALYDHALELARAEAVVEELPTKPPPKKRVRRKAPPPPPPPKKRVVKTAPKKKAAPKVAKKAAKKKGKGK